MSEHASRPTPRQMRAWLRVNRPDLNVGRRGFLSTAAVTAYREAHGLCTPEPGPARA